MIVKGPAPTPLHGDNASVAQQRTVQRIFDSRTLFGPAREVLITHNGESYSLRLTRLGKLILTK
jgi:hemin uptake protein HemP